MLLCLVKRVCQWGDQLEQEIHIEWISLAFDLVIQVFREEVKGFLVLLNKEAIRSLLHQLLITCINFLDLVEASLLTTFVSLKEIIVWNQTFSDIIWPSKVK